MAVRKRHLTLLANYLVGQPHRGKFGREQDMRCPLHDDSTRSASLNLDTGVWHCHACGEGGSVVKLIARRADWLGPGVAENSSTQQNQTQQPEVITHSMIDGWHSALMGNEHRLEEFMAKRGLDIEIIEAYKLGWDPGRACYTIPVYGPEGEVWNVRRYTLNGRDRKMRGAVGLNSPRLYPISTLVDDDPEFVVVTEGELDALLTIQQGFPAVTRTASAQTWDTAWSEFFEGRTVYLCHDCDDTGDIGNLKAAKALGRIADVHIVKLPFKHVKKHGKDLTDYWLEGHEPEAFEELLEAAAKADVSAAEAEPEETDPSDASVLDTFDSRKVGAPLRVTVTIKGKREPGYSVPRHVQYQCTRDAGQKCAVCPLNAAKGKDELDVDPSDPVVLELVESTKAQASDILRELYGAVKCNKLDITVKDFQAVEVLYARPSVEHVNGDSSAYKNMKITSVGRHDTHPNNTVRVVGALHPDPRKHMNEFLAWDVSALQTSLDNFELTPAAVKQMQKFKPRSGQRPLTKLREIAEDLSAHVTKIYGRPEMHMAMDLVFHSAIAFGFGGSRVARGWLELLVVGDTRTGKSEAAAGLVRHYRAGEVVLCESASFAGIVGGLQQYGSGKEWAITWGAVPLNDRRLVVLDEVSGLSHDAIASMSDVRSRGVAQLTKVQQEATPARTRLIWTGNPRDASMSDYTYGVQAIAPLIGNPEDIARFDIALSAAGGEVDAAEINKEHHATRQRYDAASCATLLRWVWSRHADQVVWGHGAEQAVYDAARELGRMYVENPPLIQVANVRMKIARLAVALAARLFSTDDTCEHIVVQRVHVKDAVKFLHGIYSMPGFGYYELSQEAIKDKQEAKVKTQEIGRWLRGRYGLAKFLRNNPVFRRQDLEEMLNLSREEANGLINHLWKARMVRKEKQDIRVEPALHALLREVKE